MDQFFFVRTNPQKDQTLGRKRQMGSLVFKCDWGLRSKEEKRVAIFRLGSILHGRSMSLGSEDERFGLPWKTNTLQGWGQGGRAVSIRSFSRSTTERKGEESMTGYEGDLFGAVSAHNARNLERKWGRKKRASCAGKESKIG